MKPPKNIEDEIGGALVAGCVVNPPNSARSIAAGAAAKQLGSSVVGASQDAQVAAASADALPQPTGSWQAAYLALTETELVLVRVRRGMLRMQGDGVVARIPRSAVTGAAVGDSGLQRPLRLDLSDGTAWAFGLPKLEGGNAAELFAALGVAPSVA